MLTLKDKKHLNFIIPQAYGMTCPWNKNVTMDHARDISCPDDTKLSLYKQGKFIIIETWIISNAYKIYSNNINRFVYWCCEGNTEHLHPQML